MAKVENAFSPKMANVAPVADDPRKGGAISTPFEPGIAEAPEVADFEATYRRHEFHPLVSGVLWLVDRMRPGRKSAGTDEVSKARR